MRPVAFGEALSTGTRLTLFSDDKPDRSFLPKSKTACRAEGFPEAGGRQNSFTDSPANWGRSRSMVSLGVWITKDLIPGRFLRPR